MQRLDIEQPPPIVSSDSSGLCNGRKIPLRKYSLAMCLVEAMLIGVLIYILMRQPELSPSSMFRTNQHEKHANTSTPFVIYSNGVKSARFIVGLVANCNQRKHDIQTSIKCSSSQINSCRPVELPEPSTGDTGAGLDALVVTTSKAGGRLNSRNVKLKPVDCGDGQQRCKFSTTLTITPGKLYQEIIGWGGALSDSTINNILSLTTNGTRHLLDDYFGWDGLRFNMIRITIGGSDFSSRFYTNDDSPTGDDLELKKFKLMEEDVLYKIPLIKLIQSQFKLPGRKIKLFASMWSPPTWMKTNGHFNKGYLKGSISNERTDNNKTEAYYEALSELKVKFLQAYQDNSIKWWGLTVMNEPIFAVQPFLDFNTMIFPAEDYGNYINKYLSPKIRSNPKLSHLKLIVHDDNRRFLENFTLPLLMKLAEYVDGVSTHGYIDEEYGMIDKVQEEMERLHYLDPFVLPTELCSGHLPFMEKALIGNWHRGLHYALDIIHNLQHSAAGWVDWNMALDTTGGPGWLGGRLDAPVIVDKADDSYHKSPMFYVLGQFSRYIPPGSKRVHTSIENDNYDGHFETVTFLLPEGNKYATVVVNNNPYPVQVNLVLGTQGKPHQLDCHADSVTTVVFSLS